MRHGDTPGVHAQIDLQEKMVKDDVPTRSFIRAILNSLCLCEGENFMEMG